jgi:hypothetical protein
MCSAPSPISRFSCALIMVLTAADENPVPPGISVKNIPKVGGKLLPSAFSRPNSLVFGTRLRRNGTGAAPGFGSSRTAVQLTPSAAAPHVAGLMLLQIDAQAKPSQASTHIGKSGGQKI